MLWKPYLRWNRKPQISSRKPEQSSEQPREHQQPDQPHPPQTRRVRVQTIGGDSDTLDGAREIVRQQDLGRDHIDEISRNPLPSGHTSKRWGIGIKKADGSVVLECDPWEPKTRL
jgi:hypothetical protein